MKTRIAVTAVVAVIFPLSIFAAEAPASTPASEFKAYTLDVPEKCADISAENEFSQNRFLFSTANKNYPSGYGGENLKDIANQDARLKATFPGLHSYLVGVTSLVGLCGWWPENFSLPFSVENQIVLAPGEEVVAILWGTQFAYWLNFNPARIGLSPDSETAIALEHTRWWGGLNGAANTATKKLALKIKKREVAVDAVQEMNAVSLNFAHKFALTRTATAEYAIGKYLWQVPFSRFLSDVGGILTPREERVGYRYDGFFDGAIAWRLTPLFDLAGEAKAEFSAKERRDMLGLGVVMYASVRRAFGASIFKRQYRGMEDNALYMTRWGVWAPSEDTAYELFVKLAF